MKESNKVTGFSMILARSSYDLLPNGDMLNPWVSTCFFVGARVNNLSHHCVLYCISN